MSTILTELRQAAAAQVVGYPQYAHYFDHTTLATATRDVRTKMGLAIAKGERVLLFPHATDGYPTVWSMRNRAATSVPHGAISVNLLSAMQARGLR